MRFARGLLLFVLVFVVLFELVNWLVAQNVLSALRIEKDWVAEFFALQPNFLTVGSVLLLVIAGSCCASRLLKIFFALVATVVFVVAAVDMFILTELNSRFFWNMTNEFAVGLDLSWGLVQSFLRKPVGWLFVGMASSFAVLLLVMVWGARWSRFGAGLALVLLALYQIPNGTTHLLQYQLDNIFLVNLNSLYTVKYSDEFVSRFAWQPSYTPVKGLNKRPQIILLMVESLSSYQSEFFSGLNNFTPQLDTMAAKSLAFTNFYANSYSSDQGAFCILTGLPAVHTNELGRHFLNFAVPDFYERALPKVFREAGYHTAHFSAAQLFYKQPEIVGGAGFDEIHTNRDPFYSEVSRGVFDSVPDAMLYDNLYQWVLANKKRDFLVVGTTISSHPPFQDPRTGEYSLAGAINYAQSALYDFYRRLEESGYFERGILVITADHRAMMPTTPDEYATLGPLAHARVPLLIVGSPQFVAHEKNNAMGSQMDIGPSLQYLALETAYFTDFQTNLFADNAQDRLVVHQLLYPPDTLNIYTPAGAKELILRGDRTGQNIADSRIEGLINMLNWMRIRGN